MRATNVVGGGVVGLACGLALARAGNAVTLLEPDATRAAASWGNAGHIATEQVAPLASPAAVRSAPGRLFARGGALDLPLAGIANWLPFALRLVGRSTPSRYAAGSAALGSLLREAMPAWERLASSIDAPDLLAQDGHLVAWETPETARAGRAAWAAADTGTARFRDADAADLAAIGALTGTPVAGAIRFSGSGQVRDLTALALALERAFLRAGGRIVREPARLRILDGVALVPGQPAEQVVVAAGIGSRALMEATGHKAPMVAERGYHIRAAADHWPADLPPLVFEDRSMIVTRYADCVQAASFVELNAPHAPPDPRKWERLEAHVRALGLPISGPFKRWMGARPTLPDYLPAIGRSRRARNLLYAFGHQHLGLTLAPITAELVAALAAKEAPAVDLAPFDLDRF
ncbi:NAD(P)/FAD-dependent oxidoreductase [Sphingomonas sp. 3-13AW]|uniref:NAD(P)/FAD-dependent oxidoreductase n=1 Tax=Sphingomonas sp. 3-13AW TaxID=3050450 RepID=UPI003BB66D74